MSRVAASPGDIAHGLAATQIGDGQAAIVLSHGPMATAAAAVIIAKEKDLVAHFRRAGALSPANARCATDLGVDTRFAWSILERRAIIREAGNGLYYLDEPAWVAHQQRRRRIALMMLVIVLGILAVSIFVSIHVTGSPR